MKRTILLFLLIIALYPGLRAQYNFVLQNNTASVYSSFTEAYNAAQNGDTIYLPGGEFSTPSTIDKSLVWIGVGHHPDSTSATYFTAINTYLSFTGNCDNSFFTGIFFRQALSFGDVDNDATNITLSRCRLEGGVTLKKSPQRVNIDFKMTECYSAGLNAANSSNCEISKCVITGLVSNFYQSFFDRDIFLYGRSISFGPKYVMYRDTNCLVTNSIFIKYHTSLNECESNQFLNNIFAEAIVLPQGTNSGVDNIVNAGMDHFIDVPNATVFTYENNYRIKEGSPGIGAANDGTDIGLYGGDDPLKDGFVPFNPHIRKVNIGLKTSNGLLPVEISVDAQNK